ncbi:MAG: hypothetical protein J7605_06755 [Variovorax sp.]|nr:hypothetical protein [Variovorax sp.]
MRRTLSIVAAVAVATASFLAIPPGAAQSKPPAAGSPAPDVKAFDQRTAEFQAKAKLMQQQMDDLKQTQDPQRRQKLLDEHWATMASAMSLMHGMQGPGMMGGSGMMDWSGMRGYYSTLTPEQLKQRQYVMDKYSWMQQMMMEHMLQRQQWQTQAPAPSAPK